MKFNISNATPFILCPFTTRFFVTTAHWLVDGKRKKTQCDWESEERMGKMSRRRKIRENIFTNKHIISMNIASFEQIFSVHIFFLFIRSFIHFSYLLLQHVYFSNKIQTQNFQSIQNERERERERRSLSRISEMRAGDLAIRIECTVCNAH